ncbi:hypothetical protein ATANTOWER_024797 [Ataeniobius toweri]|uniref:Uncharacterized protein n=1 Tax=Ataeniobius toweri TaxID=208326 RepID=A0ABU7B269_9TELE|nr:hypothetical protein [Ataeniobius toweri]
MRRKASERVPCSDTLYWCVCVCVCVFTPINGLKLLFQMSKAESETAFNYGSEFSGTLNQSGAQNAPLRPAVVKHLRQSFHMFPKESCLTFLLKSSDTKLPGPADQDQSDSAALNRTRTAFLIRSDLQEPAELQVPLRLCFRVNRLPPTPTPPSCRCDIITTQLEKNGSSEAGSGFSFQKDSVWILVVCVLFLLP